jgi:CheY-like chemotaxis protein
MILKDKRIFIVEDNTQNRVVFTMILKPTGAVFEFERMGRGATGRLKTFGRADLIILDLMLMGGVSGYDIFDEIRAVPEYNTVPIIAVSASEPSVAIPETQKMGFSGFIAKPIDDDRFPKQLAQVINGEQVWYAGDRYRV